MLQHSALVAHRLTCAALRSWDWHFSHAHPRHPCPCALQAADINALFGFRLECLERLGDAQGIKAWNRLNQLFNWLPLAALIENKVLCMHGGGWRGGGAGQQPVGRAGQCVSSLCVHLLFSSG